MTYFRIVLERWSARRSAVRGPGCAVRQRVNHRARRSGVTLIELMITLVLLGIVAGGMMRIIVRQQKFYTGNSGVLDTRSNVRQGMAVLQSSLRGIRPSQDIPTGGMGSYFLDFREPRGSSVICAGGAGTATIVVPPPVLSNGAGLTSWLQPPQPGDSVLVYDYENRQWIGDGSTGNVIIGVQPVEGSGVCTDLVPVLDLARGWKITLSEIIPDTVKVGASVRFYRRARYELMQAPDGDWYLGYFDCNNVVSPSTCDNPVPVSGPYLSKDAATPGLEFTYLDATGAPTTNPATLRRINMTLRAQSAIIIDQEGRAKGFYQDSLSSSVAVRNF